MEAAHADASAALKAQTSELGWHHGDRKSGRVGDGARSCDRHKLLFESIAELIEDRSSCSVF